MQLANDKRSRVLDVLQVQPKRREASDDDLHEVSKAEMLKIHYHDFSLDQSNGIGHDEMCIADHAK